MLLLKQFAGFFGYQYLWKDTIKILDILYRNIYQRNIASKGTTVGWVWPGVPSHSQTCLNLSGSEFDWSGVRITSLKIAQNER